MDGVTEMFLMEELGVADNIQKASTTQALAGWCSIDGGSRLLELRWKAAPENPEMSFSQTRDTNNRCELRAAGV